MAIAERHPKITRAQLHLEREPPGGGCRTKKAGDHHCSRLSAPHRLGGERPCARSCVAVSTVGEPLLAEELGGGGEGQPPPQGAERKQGPCSGTSKPLRHK